MVQMLGQLVELDLRLVFFLGGIVQQLFELGQLGVQRAPACFGALDIAGRAREILLRSYVGELTLVRTLARAIQRRAHLRHPRAEGIVLGDALDFACG